MKRLAAAVVVAALSLWANPSAQAAGKRVIITFKSGTTEQARAKALTSLNAVSVSTIESNDKQRKFVAVVAEIPEQGAAGMLARKLLSRLTAADAPQLDDVASIENDFTVKWIESAGASFYEMPLPISASLAELGLAKMGASSTKESARGEIPWGVDRVRAPASWDYTEGAGVRVAVIDTGIDSSHPDLQGKVDGGYDAFTDTESPENYRDGNGHGTHVAGTIAAKKDGRGVVGVAPRARLYSVRVLDADGSGSLSGVIKGIVWCANNGIQVANMSLGAATGSDTMQRALRYAKARGVIVVAAAGNSGGAVGFPAAYPETIAVAASDWNDHVAVFSSRGPEVDFIAPGVAVVSSAMGGDFANFSGTSMATPHVTGLAALAVAQGWRGLDGPDGVMAQLQKAARPLNGVPVTEQGAGMIDAGRLTRAADVMASR